MGVHHRGRLPCVKRNECSPARPGVLRGRLTLAAVVSVLGLSACGGPEVAGDREVVKGESDGIVRTAVIPTGTLEITVGSPVARVDARDTNGTKDRVAPDRSSFLPVHMAFDTQEMPWSGLLAVDLEEPEVTLRVGGQDRALPTPYYVRGPGLSTVSAATYYVVVPGSPAPEDVVASVTYDGRTQVVSHETSDPDAGTSLADLVGSDPERVKCPDTGWKSPAGIREEIMCEDLRVGVTPYWPGKGWAEEGAAWRVVWVRRLGVSRLEQGRGDYSVDAVRGSAAGQDLSGTTYPDSIDGTVVFPDTDSVRLTLEVGGSLTRGSGPLDVKARLTRDVLLP